MPQHKTCPFCGGGAEIHRECSRDGRRWEWRVVCPDCGGSADWSRSEDEAWVHWDTRHYDICPECGRVKMGLLCCRQYFDFITGELMHG